MLFSRLALFAAALFVGADACKCVNGGKDNAATRACCAQLGGNFRNGDDCQAGSISEKLSNFRRCCRDRGFTSDCDCPTCRVAADGSSDALEGEDQLIATRRVTSEDLRLSKAQTNRFVDLPRSPLSNFPESEKCADVVDYMKLNALVAIGILLDPAKAHLLQTKRSCVTRSVYKRLKDSK